MMYARGVLMRRRWMMRRRFKKWIPKTKQALQNLTIFEAEAIERLRERNAH